MKYNIIINSFSDNFRKVDFKTNSLNTEKVKVFVKNNYFDSIEYETTLEMTSGCSYWFSTPLNHKNRIVEFRDYYTETLVGLFALDGLANFAEYDINDYAKKSYINSSKGGKWNILAVFNEIIGHKVYHNDFVNVEENDVIIDIGFNYGLFSMVSLKNNPKKIIAFEPNPKLVSNYQKFLNHEKIELHQKAVSNKEGVVTFKENNDPGMSTLLSDINTYNVNDTYEVELCDFYKFIQENNINYIDYLKVDCEGSEYDIFESIPKEYLNTKVKKIALEFHHKFEDEKVQNLYNKIIDCGFEIKVIYEKNSTIGMLYARK
jgi:FkbM family methyltransferase